MGYKIEGQSCPVCKAYLFPEDDIVFCPVCGAPHHRDCYAAIGKCGLAELHGTDEQYRPIRDDESEENTQKSEAQNLCPRCGKEKIEGALFCPHCGQDFADSSAPQSNFVQFGSPHIQAGVYNMFSDPYGGVPHDGSVTIDDASVEDVRKFVFSNTQRYIPLFARQDKKHKSSWNWAAALFPHGWLFFRKHYTAGVIALGLMLLSMVLGIPLADDVNSLISSGGQVVATQQEQFNLILSLLPQVPAFSMIMAALGTVIGLATNIYFGLFGDWHYRQHVVATIKSINSDSEVTDRDMEFLKKGATSLWGFLIAYMIVEFLPQIIATFI